METGGSEWPFRISRSSRNFLDATKISNELQSSWHHKSWWTKTYHFIYRFVHVLSNCNWLVSQSDERALIASTRSLIGRYHWSNHWRNNLAVGVISGSNDYVIDGSTKIKNYQKEEVDAQCQVEDDKLVLTITGGKVGTVKITRLIKDDKLHVEQVNVLPLTVTVPNEIPMPKFLKIWNPNFECKILEPKFWIYFWQWAVIMICGC